MSQKSNENEQKNRVKFIDSFIGVIIDEAIVAIITVFILFFSDFIMNFAGYTIGDKVGMFAILYIIVNIFYISIFESSRKSATPGKIVSNIVVIKRRDSLS